MNKDDIIKLAREAKVLIREHYDETGSTPQELERFAALVAAHKTEVAIAEAYRCGHEAGVIEEREACAKVCMEIEPSPPLSNRVGWEHGTVDCAKAIRARSKQ